MGVVWEYSDEHPNVRAHVAGKLHILPHTPRPAARVFRHARGAEEPSRGTHAKPHGFFSAPDQFNCSGEASAPPNLKMGVMKP